MDSYDQLLKRLAEHGVRFVLIGGYAAAFHGAVLTTQDVDVCAPMDVDNLSRIIAALRGLNPTFRFHVKRIPLHEDAASLAGVRNIYLKTDLAFLDILGEVTGIGGFDDVLARSIKRPFHGFDLHIIDIDALIAAKRAAGRDKDKVGVAQLEAVKRVRESRPPDLSAGEVD
jgi:predicted nucleotidyltransferase